jgi:hypothetical protein
MAELIGMGIANLLGRRIADAVMDGIAAVSAIRWASLSVFVTLGPADEEGGA